MIHAYRKPDQVEKLVRAITNHGDSVWIHYDAKSPRSEFDELATRLEDLAEVTAMQRIRTYWGGFEIVEADLCLSRALIKSTVDFDFVVHLTGTTYPIKPVSQLRRFLSENRYQSFLKSDPNVPLLDESRADCTDEYSEGRRFASHHFGLTRNRPYASERNEKSSGQRSLHLRFMAHVQLLRVAKRLRMLRRQANPDIFLPSSFKRIYRGYVHDMICREHFLRVHSSPTVKRFCRELRYASAPDEVFYHTTVRNLVAPHEIQNDHYLFTRWGQYGGTSPDTLTESDIPILSESSAFFARKFASPSIVQMVHDQLVER